MNINKRTTAALAVMILLITAGCASNPSTRSDSVSGPDELDLAIRDTSDYLNDNLPEGSKIVILNIQSDSPALTDYIIDELIANTVNDKIFSVVDRQQLDAIRAEQNFQWSGEVDDKAAVDIGKLLGAQTIVSGAIGPLGERYRLRIRALEVQTATVQGQYNRNMIPSPILNDLVKGGSSTGTRTAAATPQAAQAASGGTSGQTAQPVAPAAQPAAPALPAYKIGDTGPAGGLIFYDKGNNNGGWRYLEAAPVETEFQAVWSVRETKVDNTQEGIGYGKRNTQLIVDTFSKTSGEWDTAAQKADDLVFNGFDDWFLPSRAELDQMYGNLKRRNLGDFKGGWYFSSSLYIETVYIQNFTDGEMSNRSKNYRYYVRPIRQVAGQ